MSRTVFYHCVIHKKKSNIINGVPYHQTQSYYTLLNTRWCMFTLMYNRSSLYTLSLQSSTMPTKLVPRIAFSFECGNKISQRFFCTALWGFIFIHKARVHRCKNQLKIGTPAKASIWTLLYTYKFYLQASRRQRRLEGSYIVYDFLLFFWLRFSTVVSRQPLYNEEWNNADCRLWS